MVLAAVIALFVAGVAFGAICTYGVHDIADNRGRWHGDYRQFPTYDPRYQGEVLWDGKGDSPRDIVGGKS